MNSYVAAAWGLTGIFAVTSVSAFAIAIAAYLNWVRIDAVSAVTVGIAFGGYVLAPLGYARARS